MCFVGTVCDSDTALYKAHETPGSRGKRIQVEQSVELTQEMSIFTSYTVDHFF